MDNNHVGSFQQSSAIELGSAEAFFEIIENIRLPKVIPAQRADFWKRKLLTSPDHIIRFLQDFLRHRQPDSSHQQEQTRYPVVFMIYSTRCSVCKADQPVVNAFADKYRPFIPTFKLEGSLLYQQKIPQETHMRMQSSASSIMYADSYDTALADSDTVGELLQYFPALFIYHPVYGEFLQLAKAQDLEECGEQALKEARQASHGIPTN